MNDLTTNPIQSCVRQGDTISSKLFILPFEGVFKQLDWDRMGININGTYLNHLRFADNIMLIVSDVDEVNQMRLDWKR